MKAVLKLHVNRVMMKESFLTEGNMIEIIEKGKIIEEEKIIIPKAVERHGFNRTI